jgi:hypothetical protein
MLGVILCHELRPTIVAPSLPLTLAHRSLKQRGSPPLESRGSKHPPQTRRPQPLRPPPRRAGPVQ